MKTDLEYLSKMLVTRTIDIIDELFIVGLEKKGFEFESDKEVQEFIIEHCGSERVGDSVVYYVKGVPFIRTVNIEDMVLRQEDDKWFIDGGYYEYL